VRSSEKPWWRQAPPLVSLSTSGALIGFSFVPGTAADMTSPTSMPHLLALEKIAAPEHTAQAEPAAEAALRSAIVNVAGYYLRMARSKTPAEMDAIIWGVDSVNGANHGESCAAFASMTLELAAQSVGQQSWVTGGTTYPWPLHEWADVRVDPNPDSLGVVSIQQDAQAHGRWHPLGDGYRPQPGDWVLFDGHVEVVTKYAGGVLSSIGADSLPNLTVNAHESSDPLSAAGVVGFVDNGGLSAAGTSAAGKTANGTSAGGASASRTPASGTSAGRTPAADTANADRAAIPGLSAAAPASAPVAAHAPAAESSGRVAASGAAAIPGASQTAGGSPPAGNSPAASRPPAASYNRHQSTSGTTSVPETAAQQAFISAVAPGAVASQVKFGISAAVTIAQAIDESGWGQSELAVRDHNLFGIKGTGPAGTDLLPSQEYENGHWATVAAPFRVYHNVAESIADHSQLLATNPAYQRAMADRAVPNAFATDLTGVYATDPSYGANLIALMQLYDLYRYDDVKAAAISTGPAVPPAAAPSPGGAQPVTTQPATTQPPPSRPTAAQPAQTQPAVLPPGLTPPAVPAPSIMGPTATVPGTPATTGRATGGRTAASATRGGASIPGLTALRTPRATTSRATTPRATTRRGTTRRYQRQLPATVTEAYISTAKAPIMSAEPLYRDVASFTGISWQLLAACDWMQCAAQPRHSPVHGEKLGTLNPDGTAYHTKSEALAQCAQDMIELSRTIYQIRLRGRDNLSVSDLANVFAAFRWGALLRQHNISAMEFPYSVQGLTMHQLKMRWPKIPESDAPDRPGTRFRAPFGAVPVVLSLDYPAIA